MSEYEVVLDRQWKMIQALSSDPKGLTLEEMSTRFQCSEKTIKRDIKSIESVFGPLKARFEAHGRKRYINDRALFTYGLALEPSELLALYVGQKLLDPLRGTYFWDDVNSGYEKIAKILRKDAVDYAERVAPLFYRFDPIERRYSRQTRESVDAITKALGESRVLEIRYRSLQARRAKTYQICPYNFIYWHSAAYLVGLCCSDRKVKFWKIDRLLSAEIVANRRFKRPADFDVQEYMSNVLAPFVGDAPVGKVTIRFTDYAARLVQEEKPKNVESVTEQEDGSVIVEMTTEMSKTFIRWLLQYGVHAEILAPSKLREQAVAELREMLGRYGASEGTNAARDAKEEEKEETVDDAPNILQDPDADDAIQRTYDVEVFDATDETDEELPESIRGIFSKERKSDEEQEERDASLTDEEPKDVSTFAVEESKDAEPIASEARTKENAPSEPLDIDALEVLDPNAFASNDAKSETSEKERPSEPSEDAAKERSSDAASKRKSRRARPLTGKEMLAMRKNKPLEE